MPSRASSPSARMPDSCSRGMGNCGPTSRPGSPRRGRGVASRSRDGSRRGRSAGASSNPARAALTMCGIAGIIGPATPALADMARVMSRCQAHRGPDSEGFWQSSHAAFAFRRLAIIDLSDDGRQPMTDPETGNVIVYNGEIYNYQALRRELEGEGARFRSRCDTEVILKAYARWGADGVSRLRGMFAFALWDAARGTLLFARDRLGIKPLYLCSVTRPGKARTVLFASEVRALLASDLLEREVDTVALASYVWNGFVVGPRTIVRGVELLPAATCAIASNDGVLATPQRYWR